MKIAIDVSPLKTGHKIRGTGFYLSHLQDALLKYYPENEYVFFQRGDKLPKDIDLVHFPYFEPFFLALPIYRRFKTVVTVHDLTPIVFPEAFPRGLKGEIKWQMQRFALRQANAIITDSNSSKKDIKRIVGVSDARIHVVYLAAGEGFRKLEIGKWKMEIQKRYNLPDRFLLYVGDVTWNKNLPRLLSAVKDANIPLVMIGKSLVSENFDKDNPWNHDLVRVQSVINEQKSNSQDPTSKNKKLITALGFVESEDLVKIYNLATAFVMPSLYEGFGLPVLEAMACGTPVITTKEGSLHEVAGEAAYYVDAYDVESIKKGIEIVFMDKELQKELSNKATKNVNKFSWRETASQTLKVYKQLFNY